MEIIVTKANYDTVLATLNEIQSTLDSMENIDTGSGVKPAIDTMHRLKTYISIGEDINEDIDKYNALVHDNDVTDNNKGEVQDLAEEIIANTNHLIASNLLESDSKAELQQVVNYLKQDVDEIKKMTGGITEEEALKYTRVQELIDTLKAQ